MQRHMERVPSPSRSWKSLGLLAALCLALAGRALAADWPHWRGPGRNGVTEEPSGWKGGKWPGEKPQWTSQVGAGASSPVVTGGRLYALGWRGGREQLVCLDAATGRRLWVQSYAAPRYGRHKVGDEFLYAGPSSTPEFDADTGLLFTLGIDGDLRAWDASDEGRGVWQINLYEAYGVPQRPDVGRNSRRDYGYTTSPLVYGGWLIVEVGGAEGTLAAFDKRTGELQWWSECRDEAGHTGGPVLMTVEGIPCVAVLTLRSLLVVRLDEGHAGQTLARHPWATHYANNIASPAVHENFVVITSGYNQSAMCKLKITRAGAEKVWERPLHSKVCSPVIHEGRVYWAWRGVHCLDFETGQTLWSGGNVGDPGSCIVTGDGRLIVFANNGNLLLLETGGRSPDKATILAQTPPLFRSDAWPHVALAAGRLYCKDRDGNIACFEL